MRSLPSECLSENQSYMYISISSVAEFLLALIDKLSFILYLAFPVARFPLTQSLAYVRISRGIFALVESLEQSHILHKFGLMFFFVVIEMRVNRWVCWFLAKNLAFPTHHWRNSITNLALILPVNPSIPRWFNITYFTNWTWFEGKYAPILANFFILVYGSKRTKHLVWNKKRKLF